MNILGYSGLHGSLDFCKKNYTGLTEQEYRMCQGLDSAACVLVNGELIAAAEEERFNGEKHTDNFPINAINFCLKKSGLDINNIDYVCHSFDHKRYKELYAFSNISKSYYRNILSDITQRKIWESHFPGSIFQTKFVSVNHHLAHAATAYYPSGFDSSLIMIADGLGEAYSISLYQGKGKDINLLNSYDLFSSVGILYSQITAHLGFEVNSDEYKVMGLAPYGDPKKYQNVFDEIIEYRDDGSIYINKFNLNKTPLDRQTGRAFRHWFAERTHSMRSSGEPITQQHKDIAASLQQSLEKTLFHILHYWKKKTDAKNLCLAGGVALNCTANGSIFREKIFKDIYIQPAAGDSGTSIGAAMIQSYLKGEGVDASRFKMPFFGPEFSDEEYLSALKKYKKKVLFKKISETSIIEEAASWITNRKIIAWMQGRMEFGPRALGNRSILADPTDPTMRDRINLLIKKREGFRPFAPSVKLEKAHHYFDVPEMQEFPHMLYTVFVKKEYRNKLPSITHVDGTARIQTVNKIYAKKYWELINAVEKNSGIPILLNTSFNVKGQPIVCTPEEAIETLILTKIDALFMGNYLVTLI